MRRTLSWAKPPNNIQPIRFIRCLLIILTINSSTAMSSIAEIIDNKTPDKSISSKEFIQINGAKQFILIRGNNIDNPIFLYIHGGPGTSELPLLTHYNKDLENHFIVVYWEQRATGKSYSRKIAEETHTVSQFVEDGYELSKYLKKRFDKEKIIICGHSWGTIVSTQLAIKYPDLYLAYIGIGQLVDMKKGEQLSFNFTMSKAYEANNEKAINKLHAINNPPYLTIEDNPRWFKQLKAERKWLTYFGGEFYNQKDYRLFTKVYLKSKDYSVFDMIKFAQGSLFSLKRLWPEIMEINLLNGFTDFKIPVYLIQGKYDYNSPSQLVEEYFNKIKAPEKELLLFEKSGHSANFEENARFNQTIIDLFKTK